MLTKPEAKKTGRRKKDELEVDYGATQGNVCLLSIIANDLSTLLHEQSMEHPSAMLLAKCLTLQLITAIYESIEQESKSSKDANSRESSS